MSRQGVRPQPLPPGERRVYSAMARTATPPATARRHDPTVCLLLALFGALNAFGLFPAAGLKVDFNALRAPSGYVAGMGRGAAGFTTRSDIGPSMPAPDVKKDKAGTRAGGLVVLVVEAQDSRGSRPCRQPAARSPRHRSRPPSPPPLALLLLP